MLLGAFRTILALTIGAWIVKNEIMDSAAWEQLIGALMIAAPIIWSVVDKHISEKYAKERESVALNAGITISNRQPNLITPPVDPVDAPAAIKSVAAQ